MTRRDALARSLGLTAVAGAAPPGADRIDAMVDDAVRRWGSPGFAGAVVRGDRLAWLGARGRRRHDRPEPVTPRTPFPLASCTKGFTAALAAVLVGDGVIRWDDPLRKHLPGLQLSNDPAVQGATLRDCLSHRSGFGPHDFLWYRAPWDLADTLRRAGRVPPAAKPGREYHYTSVAFAAAGEALAAAAKTTWAELIRRRLAEPLGMALTAMGRDFAATPGRAHGYRRTPDGKGVEPVPLWLPDGANPAGTLAAAAADLVPWLRHVLRADPHKELFRPHIRQPASAELAAQFPLSREVQYGLGWVLFDYRGEAVAAHGGVADGFRSQLLLVPRLGLGMAFLNNLHDSRMNQALAQTVLDEELGAPPFDWHGYYLGMERAGREGRAARPPAGTPPALPLAAYAGTYHDPAYGDATVTTTGGSLVWRWSSFEAKLEPSDGETFRATDGYFAGQTLRFRLEAGRPAALEPPAGVECIFRRA